MTLNDHIMQQPTWLVAWVGLLVVISLLAIPFAIKDARPRWIILAFIGAAILMNLLYEKFGYTRILGLAHIVFWTPVWIYIWRNRNKNPQRAWTNRYLVAWLLIAGISLIIDYADVIRYILGDKGPL